MSEKEVKEVKEVKEATADANPQNPINPIAALIQKTRPLRAPKLLICGNNKIGKTTFAQAAPKAIGLLLEDGGNVITGDTFPIAKTLAEMNSYLQFLETEKHAYQSVYIDSLDWLEPIIHDHTCKVNGWATIEQAGFGKGYVAATYQWRDFFNTLDRLNARGMAVLLISHVKIKTITSPIVESYDSYVLKLHDKASALACEWADIIGFCAPKLLTTSSNTGFANTTKAIATGERILHLEANPSYPSGNRYSMKDQPLDAALFWKNFTQAIKTK